MTIDETVSKQEDTHAKTGCNPIFFCVVAYHQTFFCRKFTFPKNVFIVGWIGLAVARIFIGGDQLKILLVQSCPADPAFCRQGREDRIGC